MVGDGGGKEEFNSKGLNPFLSQPLFIVGTVLGVWVPPGNFDRRKAQQLREGSFPPPPPSFPGTSPGRFPPPPGTAGEARPPPQALPVLSLAEKPGELSLARLGLGGPSSKFSAMVAGWAVRGEAAEPVIVGERGV